MTDEIDLHAWQSDGHRLFLEAKLFEERNGRKWGMLVVRTECPENSTCRRWAADHNSTHTCMVQADIEATGSHDFIDGAIDATGLPADWSSVFPMRIEWKDEGEDGIRWRPVTGATVDDVTVTFPADEAEALGSLRNPATLVSGAVSAVWADAVVRAARRIREARGQ